MENNEEQITLENLKEATKIFLGLCNKISPEGDQNE